jgi:hypothetical protein
MRQPRSQAGSSTVSRGHGAEGARLLGIDDSKVMPVDDDREDPLVRKAHDLDELVAAGESEKTPFILLGRVWIVIAAAVLVIFALAMLAYSLAT